MYGFLYVTDKYEGLVVVGNPDLKGKNPGVGTLLDGNPENNFIGRAATFNPGGILNGARRITIAGTYAYILCDRGLVVVDLDQSARAARDGGNRRARSGRPARRRRAIPLRLRRRSPGTENARRDRPRASAHRARRICEAGRRAQCLPCRARMRTSPPGRTESRSSTSSSPSIRASIKCSPRTAN